MLDIRQISAAGGPLRHRMLRPHQPPEALVYPGDDHPLSFNAGAFLQDQLVGIASVAPEACPLLTGTDAWRLCGMATLPEVQRQGYGAALIRRCIAHIKAHDGRILWCNGRTSALPFYRALSFAPLGEEFLTPGTGPHYVCVLELDT